MHSILKIKTGEDGIGPILLTVGNKRTDDCQIIRKHGRLLKPTATAVTTPPGGGLGSVAEDGRAKQRYASGRRMEPLIRRLPNGTSQTLVV